MKKNEVKRPVFWLTSFLPACYTARPRSMAPFNLPFTDTLYPRWLPLAGGFGGGRNKLWKETNDEKKIS